MRMHWSSISMENTRPLLVMESVISILPALLISTKERISTVEQSIFLIGFSIMKP